MSRNFNIVVICGGFSSEREISLQSSLAVSQELAKNNYNVSLLDIANPDILIKVFPDKPIDFKEPQYSSFDSHVVQKLLNTLMKISELKVFIGLHGGEGENGKLQSFFDLCDISYTGSGYKASTICMDKILSKVIAQNGGIYTAHFKVFTKELLKSVNDCQDLEESISQFDYPVVFKANSQGSSVGVYILQSFQDFCDKFSEIKTIDDDFLLEEYIVGREVSIPIIKGKSYPIVEIKTHDGFYDYKHKYTDGITDHICPASLSSKTSREICSFAKDIYKYTDCKDYARIDFIIDKQDKPYFLEINTLPGMTKLSLTPESAKEAGISFIELLEMILNII